MTQKFAVGQSFQHKFTVDAQFIQAFSDLFGDDNPIHVDQSEAKNFGYPRQVAHGAIMSGLLSRMIGTVVPGPGTIWMNQSINWINPVFAGDEIELTVTVEQISQSTGIMGLQTEAKNQSGTRVMEGSAQVKTNEKLTNRDASNGNAGRVALVTGGSGGIGAAIARSLAQRGVNVAVGYRQSADEARSLVQEIEAAGGAAQEFNLDLGDPSSPKSAVTAVTQAFGRLDTVVHAASLPIGPGDVHNLSYEDVEAHLRISLGGALGLVTAASPGMVEGNFGRFIFLGTGAMTGVPPVGWSAYLTAKHALWGLTVSLATELGPSGVTSNMVSPGMTVTDLTADIPARAKQLEAHRSPMRRLAKTEDTSELIAFLASDEAGYINGVNLPVTGGPV